MVEEGNLDDKLEDKATNEVVDDVKKVAMEGVDKERKLLASLLSHKSYFPFDEKLVACSQDHHSLTFFCNSLPSSVTAVQPALGELVCVHLYCLYSKSYCLQLFLCTLTWNKKKIKTRTICSTMVHIFDNCSILYSLSLYTSLVQLTTSSRRLDGGAFCVASVGGK